MRSPLSEKYDTAFRDKDDRMNRTAGKATDDEKRPKVHFPPSMRSKQHSSGTDLKHSETQWHTNVLALTDPDGLGQQGDSDAPETTAGLGGVLAVGDGGWEPENVFDYSTLVKGRDEEKPPVIVNLSLKIKLGLVYVTILGEVLVDAFTEPLRVDDVTVHVLTFSFLIFMRLATLMAFCLLTSEIMFIRMALYEEYFSAFSPLFFTALVSSLFFIAVRTWYLFMIFEQYPPMVIWTQQGGLYSGFYAAARSVNVIYYGVLVVSAQIACQDRFFTEECLKKR